jgi:hypothetical protein
MKRENYRDIDKSKIQSKKNHLNQPYTKMEDSANMEAMSSVEIMVQKALAQLENFRILDTHPYDVSFI